MTAQLIDGKARAQAIYDSLQDQVSKLDVKPGLGLILVGDDPASHVYVGMKEKKCQEIGFYVEKHVLDKETSEMDVLAKVDELNQNNNIHGILVQLPLPKHIDENLVVDAILADKDADGFTALSQGFLANNQPRFVAATSKGIVDLIKTVKQDLTGMHAVVVGRSNVVGKPAAQLLLMENCTVTICHSKTKNLKEHTKQADILVAAVGKPNMINADMIKPGAIVIDAGTTKVNDKLTGDVEFEAAKEVAGYITPVPGGVGPMTIAMLLQNTLAAYKNSKKL